MIKFICFDNYEWLKTQPSNSFDSCVTDAPYGLGEEPNPMLVMQDWCWKGYYEVEGGGFMGKKWDAFVPQPAFWKEVYRVLKPGAYVLCFFGTRTYDWGVMAMRFANFEIRDCLQWIYGSGFPKGVDISKAIDKIYGAERNETSFSKSGARVSSVMDMGSGGIFRPNDGHTRYDVPATDAAKKWDGWNTALKPAHEPIVLARKPIEQPTVAENVLRYGTGAINVDACRIGYDGGCKKEDDTGGFDAGTVNAFGGHLNSCRSPKMDGLGRWPANVIFDEEAAKLLDRQSGVRTSGIATKGQASTTNNIYGNYDNRSLESYGDSGGASRYFYVAKASTAERNFGLEGFEKKVSGGMSGTKDGSLLTGSGNVRNNLNQNTHPTVKPISLMRWLVRLITPKDGHCIDPFGGSGTTGIACKLEGMDCTLIDNDKESCEIAEARIKAYFFQDKLFDL